MPAPGPLEPSVTDNQFVACLVAVQVQLPTDAVTPTVPVVAAAPGDALVASRVNVHGAPACVTVNVCPAIASVPVRGVVARFAATAYPTVPLPMPLGPDVTVNQVGALLVAVQVQLPTDAVTPTVPVVAAAPGDALVASRVNVHGAPACVIVKICPAIVSVPVRGVVVRFAATAYPTVPLPVPLDPDVTVNQVGALLVAVQVQLPTDDVTPTAPVVAAAPGDALVASNVNVHGAPAW